MKRLRCFACVADEILRKRSKAWRALEHTTLSLHREGLSFPPTRANRGGRVLDTYPTDCHPLGAHATVLFNMVVLKGLRYEDTQNNALGMFEHC